MPSHPRCAGHGVSTRDTSGDETARGSCPKELNSCGGGQTSGEHTSEPRAPRGAARAGGRSSATQGGWNPPVDVGTDTASRGSHCGRGIRTRPRGESKGLVPAPAPPPTADSPLCPAGWRAVAPGAQAGAFQSWRAQGRGGALSQSPCALAGGPGRTKRSQWSLQDVYAGVPRPRQALWGAGPTTRGLQQGDAGDPQFLPPEPARPGLSLPR